MPARIMNIVVLYFNCIEIHLNNHAYFLTKCFVGNFNSDSVGFSAQWFIGSFRPFFFLNVYVGGQKKKKQHFKGLCHILPHPTASGAGDRRSV